MIPYEELERALARWKVRRSGAVEPTEVGPGGDETPAGILSGTAYVDRDSTGELELSDAEVDDSREEV